MVFYLQIRINCILSSLIMRCSEMLHLKILFYYLFFY
nr:MAG TPA: hypothetical protein [Caudoviricetes sp.]DAV07110.1 MAG TPA: hypothetical protein [Caudoviricetes sp.]